MFVILCNIISVHVIAYAYSKNISLMQLYRLLKNEKKIMDKTFAESSALGMTKEKKALRLSTSAVITLLNDTDKDALQVVIFLAMFPAGIDKWRLNSILSKKGLDSFEVLKDIFHLLEDGDRISIPSVLVPFVRKDLRLQSKQNLATVVCRQFLDMQKLIYKY